MGHQIHRPLHTKGRLGPARTPVGSGGRLVGHHSQHLYPGRRSRVGTDYPVAGPVGRPWSRVCEVGAAVADYPQPDSQDGPVVAHGGFHVDRMAPAVEAQHILLAVGHPLDGLAQLHRQVAHRQVFRKYTALLTESSAYIGGYHPDGVLRPVQQPGDLPLHPVSALGGGPDGQGAVLGPAVSQQPAGLHGHRRQPLHVVPLPDDQVRLGESGVQLLALAIVMNAQRDIGTHIRVHRGRIRRSRFPGVHDCRQGLVIGLYHLQRISGLRGLLGYHNCHGLPYVGHFTDGQGRMFRPVELIYRPFPGHGPGRQVR